MKKALFLLSFCLALATCSPKPVFAADLPTKAPAFAPALSLDTTGLYFGLWTTGGMGTVQGSAVQVTGANPNSITATEAAIGGLVGYYWAMSNSTQFIAVEGMLGWQNVNGNAQGFSFDGPVTGKIRFMTGAPVSTIMAAFPQLFPFPVPGFPSNVGNITNIKPYLYAAPVFDDVSVNVGAGANRTWSIAPEFGVGMLGQVSPTTAVDVFAGVKLPQKGACIGFAAGTACAGMGTTAVAGLAFKW
jgi:hypothetical protein